MRRWLAGAALVSLGWLASPGSVPVYDGVGQPDDPYLSVGSDPGPRTVSTTIPVSLGASDALQLKSAETGPQILLDLTAGAFTSAGTSLTLTATPLAPDGAPPRGQFDGNTYRVTATTGAALKADTAQGFLFLRARVMTKPAPTIVHRSSPSSPWVQAKTTKAGQDILSTPFRDLGDYAVVRLPGAKPLSAGGLSVTRVVLLAGGVLLLLTLTVLVLRRPNQEEPA